MSTIFQSFDSFNFHDTDSISDVERELERFPTAKPITQSPSYAGPGAPPPEYTAPCYRTASEYRELLLPRRIYDEKQPTSYRLARPGELMDEKGRPAILYDFWRTPAEALDEFGIGVSLYFRILRAIILVCLICGCISVLAMYQNQRHQVASDNGAFTSSGCLKTPQDPILPTVNETASSFMFLNPVPFATTQRHSTVANTTQSYQLYTPFRILGSVYGTTARDLRLSRQGLSDLIISGLLIILTAMAGIAMKHQIQKIDVSQQTTKDYSVVITNPPLEIEDPQEYYDFFSQFGEIVLITVAKTNGHILRIFAKKKRGEADMVKVDQYLRMLFAHRAKSWTDQLKVQPSLSSLPPFPLFYTLSRLPLSLTHPPPLALCSVFCSLPLHNPSSPSLPPLALLRRSLSSLGGSIDYISKQINWKSSCITLPQATATGKEPRALAPGKCSSLSTKRPAEMPV
jgi:hypothetical protein